MVTSRSLSSSCRTRAAGLVCDLHQTAQILIAGEGDRNQKQRKTPAYFSAVHKLVAVIDVGWRSARQSPGKSQAGGAAIIQVDERHLGRI